MSEIDRRQTYPLAVHLELTKKQLLELAGRSELLREDPRRPWTIGELKAHARHAVAIMAIHAADRI